MSEILDEVSDWQRNNPAFDGATTETCTNHLMEEIGELLRSLGIQLHKVMPALVNGYEKQPGAVAKELGDVVHLLVAVSDCKGVDLVKAVHDCLQINKARKWKARDPNTGLVNHEK